MPKHPEKKKKMTMAPRPPMPKKTKPSKHQKKKPLNTKQPKIMKA